MSPTKLVGNIVFQLVNLSINDLILIDKMVQRLSTDSSGEFTNKIRGLITATSPPAPTPPTPIAISAEEKRQLEQTIETGEEILLSLPNDIDSLELLKEAYAQLGRREEELNACERLIEAYVICGRTSESILEQTALLEIRAKVSPPAS